MAKSQTPKHQKPQPEKKTAGNKIQQNRTLLERLDTWIGQREKTFLWVSLGTCLLFALLLFDMKISIGGDDSGYVERAYKFMKGGEFPFYQGPFYPVVLILPLTLFGLNIAAVKVYSVLFAVGHVFFMWKAFRNRIPNVVLYTVLLFIGVNSFVQAYSSLTYTEAFFMFMQAIGIYFSVVIIDKAKAFGDDVKRYWVWIILAGAWFIMLSLTKSIAIVCFLPLLAYFLLQRQWKTAGAVLLAVIAARAAWEVLIRATVGAPQFGQFNDVLLKDMYNESLGYEDLSGLISRFWKNLETFISLHFYRIIHFRGFTANEAGIGLGLFTTLILLVITAVNFRKNQYILFASLYVIVLCGGIFFGIQANNMQDRLIVIAVPLILLAFLGGLYQLAQKIKGFQVPVFLLMLLLISLSLGFSMQKSAKNSVALRKNLNGDIYYGFTPDWVNYLKMSKWCADSLPEGSLVLARKGNMSFIYSNGSYKFFGWAKVPSEDADSLLSWLQVNKITHVMLASLRTNPAVNNGSFISTMHRIVIPIQQKYPNKIRFVRREGDTEPTDLIEIIY